MIPLQLLPLEILCWEFWYLLVMNSVRLQVSSKHILSYVFSLGLAAMLCSVIMNPKYLQEPVCGSTLLSNLFNAATWRKVE